MDYVDYMYENIISTTVGIYTHYSRPNAMPRAMDYLDAILQQLILSKQLMPFKSEHKSFNDYVEQYFIWKIKISFSNEKI